MSTRSPKAPRLTLKECIKKVEKLFGEASTAVVTRDVAAQTMGYSGKSGPSLTLIASLLEYGLLLKKGTDVRISDLAVKILHPINEGQKMDGIREAIRKPGLYSQLLASHSECGAAVIKSHLVQQGFKPDSAQKTASVFLDNLEFAKMKGVDYSSDEENPDENGEPEYTENEDATPRPMARKKATPVIAPEIQNQDGNMIAEISVPLAGNQLKLALIGDNPVLEEDIEDIDALMDYLKRQLRRKVQRSAPKPEPDIDDDSDLE